jgi:hypothetical protein
MQNSMPVDVYFQVKKRIVMDDDEPKPNRGRSIKPLTTDEFKDLYGTDDGGDDEISS